MDVVRVLSNGVLSLDNRVSYVGLTLTSVRDEVRSSFELLIAWCMGVRSVS
jgi:hypothetical protein